MAAAAGANGNPGVGTGANETAGAGANANAGTAAGVFATRGGRWPAEPTGREAEKGLTVDAVPNGFCAPNWVCVAPNWVCVVNMVQANVVVFSTSH